ncbi:hypothetical protein K503DRAFT_800411 [Rhizopogon vinicolor AM-OR11-026]|uniref:LysM domain-containing protein n=1 Tax=Rhizopogon vinicolor AM-OR11-026 TaxID=1314800 RepID=A0A1B7N0V5_9AGAM|nr:hypothetical protein K503DRAFT_800411 [Rhizopogon vinicolor AM-OR11-026]
MHTSFSTTKFAALMALASVVAGTNLPDGCARTAVVQSGNTCDDISAAYNVSTYQLAAVNGDMINVGCTNLYPGETLCLGIKDQDCDTTHVVVKGETCYSVAGAAGISVTTLLDNNPNLNTICTNMYTGEVLCTSSHVYVSITYT